MTEEWRDIPGWEGLYQASSEGRIRSVDRMAVSQRSGQVYRQRYKGRVLVPTIAGNYLSVSLSLEGKKITRHIHVLVCAAFYGPRPHRMEAAHWDGNRANNRAKNLRWATSSENELDKIRHGVRRGGFQPRLTDVEVRAVRQRKGLGERSRDLAAEFGVSRQTIDGIAARTLRSRVT